MKIIDGHAHIYPEEFKLERDRIAAREPWFDTLTSSKVNKWGTAEGFVEYLDANGIESGFATSFAFHDQGLCRAANDYVLDAARRYPGRILPLAVVSPSRPGMEEEVVRCFEAGAVGIGELFPDGQNFDIADVSQTWRLAAKCHEHNLFIMFHTAEQAGHQYPGKGLCGAEKAAKFCLNHPEVRVVFAHFGGGLWAFEAMPEMKLALSNAYYDTAAWPWLYGPKIIDAIFAIGAGEKAFFGSDWPILEFPRYHQILSQTSLDINQREALLYKTASSLLLQR